MLYLRRFERHKASSFWNRQRLGFQAGSSPASVHKVDCKTRSFSSKQSRFLRSYDMKVFVIPDIHQTNLWVKAAEEALKDADKIIFLGDYVDSFDSKSLENTEWSAENTDRKSTRLNS